MGVVYEVKVVENAKGRQVILWDTTDHLPKKPEIKETKTEKIKRLEKDIRALKKLNSQLSRQLEFYGKIIDGK